MMPDERALLNAVLESPSDDAPRLIMADFLDEHGECDRAEFIKIQMELARLTASDGHVKDCYIGGCAPGNSGKHPC